MPEKITGKDPYMISLDAVILFWGLLRYFWNPQKDKKNGNQFINPSRESFGSKPASK